MGTVRNDRPWFQVQADIIDSIDINRLSDRAERYFWRLNALCCRHGVGDTIPWSAERIAQRFRITLRKFETILTELETLGTDGEAMIEVTHNSIRIVKWHDYQPASTGSERKSIYRKESRRAAASRRAADLPRGGRAPAAVLEAEAEAELEEEHTHGTAVREGLPPDPPKPARVPVPTNDQITSRWDAAMAGLGLKIQCGKIGYHHAESLFKNSSSDEEAKAVAAYHRSKLSENIDPNPAKFVSEYPTRLAQWESSKTARPPQGTRENPKLGAASPAAKQSWNTPRSQLGEVKDTW